MCLSTRVTSPDNSPPWPRYFSIEIRSEVSVLFPSSPLSFTSESIHFHSGRNLNGKFDVSWPIFRDLPWKWVGDCHFDDFLSKLVGKIVILTLGAIESASFNSNFGTSVEMDPILTKFDQF